MEIYPTNDEKRSWCFVPSRVKTTPKSVSVAMEEGLSLFQCEFVALYQQDNDWLLSFSRVPDVYDWGFHVTHYFQQQGVADVLYLEPCDTQVILLVIENYQLISEMCIDRDDLADYLSFLGPQISRVALVQSGLSEILQQLRRYIPALNDKEMVLSPPLTRFLTPDTQWRFQPADELLPRQRWRQAFALGGGKAL
ncbi:MAG: hypothetical protein AAGB12_13015 [Pseudomonadota bacterium]